MFVKPLCGKIYLPDPMLFPQIVFWRQLWVSGATVMLFTSLAHHLQKTENMQSSLYKYTLSLGSESHYTFSSAKAARFVAKQGHRKVQRTVTRKHSWTSSKVACTRCEWENLKKSPFTFLLANQSTLWLQHARWRSRVAVQMTSHEHKWLKQEWNLAYC